VRLHLPGVADIPLGAAVKLAARGEAEFRPLGEESFAVSKDHRAHGIVQRILGAAGEGSGSSCRSKRGAASHLRRNAKEFGKSSAQDAVEIHAVPENMRTQL